MIYFECVDIFLIMILVINIKSGTTARSSVKWEDYSEDGLPPMFAIEDFFKCEEQHGTFCKAEIRITPGDPNSTLAKEIKSSSETRFRFLRSSVYRMICIPQEYNDTLKVKDYIGGVVGKQLQEYNVTLEVVDYTCNVNRLYNVYDCLIWLMSFMYIWLLYKATANDVKGRKPRDKWIKILSIRENWHNITKKNSKPDFQKLKSLQGIRVLSTIPVISFHTKLTFGILFLDNPKDWEQIFANKLVVSSFQTGLFIVQIYFMISTFLLTNQIYELHKKHGYFSLTHCFNLFVNRICRFLPTLLVIILYSLPISKLLPQGTVLLDSMNTFCDNTVSTWWATLLQINYIFSFSKMCLPGTWYLSVDTFMYATTIILLYVQLKYQLDIKKVLAVTFSATTLIFAYIIHSGNLDIMFTPDLEVINRLLMSSDFEKLYLSPFSSWNTCFVGMAMGAIYFHNKNKKIEINSVLEKIWLVTFLLLPVLVVYVSTYEYAGLTRAIIGSLLKPTFALAFGIGILGMSKGLGGVIKKTLEWDFAVKMSHFTFCTYVFQFFFIFTRDLFTRGLVHYQKFDVVWYICQDVTLSFMAGILMTLIVEHPGLTLQKMIIPQINNPEKIKMGENRIQATGNGFKVEEYTPKMGDNEVKVKEHEVKMKKNGVKLE